MEVKNLYDSYTEIFDLKESPYQDDIQILPFFIENDQKTDSACVKILRPALVFTPSINGYTPISKNEVIEGDIPTLILNGEILGYYLPFHFYYSPDKNEENQIWGVHVKKSAINLFRNLLKDIDCDVKTKELVTIVYICHFALFYHKIEIFVTNNEIFERDMLYKYHFSILTEKRASLIDTYAHNYSCNRILESSATKNIAYKLREKFKVKFSDIFQVENTELLSHEVLLNEIYNDMHQPSKKRSQNIWVDLNHLFDSHINFNRRDNIFFDEP